MIEIATSGDRDFLLPLAVMLESLRRSHGIQRIRVSVLTDSLRPQDLAAFASDMEIVCIDVPADLVAGAHVPGYLRTPTLYRLLLPEVMPGDVDRILYIDADTIIRRDLSTLSRHDLDGHALAAVMDPVVPWASCPDGLPWQQLSLQPDAPYFNAGMMVIDLHHWRRERIGQRAIDLLREKQLPHADQGSLNAILEGRWKRLPPEWNLQAGHLETARSLAHIVERHETLMAARNDPAIVHFNSSPFGRPWAAGCVHPFRDEWLKYLNKTPFCGWRPPARVPRLPLATRLKRAASLILRG